jgi:hypothetical protein
MQSVILTRMSVIVTLTSVIMKCEVSVSNQHSAWHYNRTRLRVGSTRIREDSERTER